MRNKRTNIILIIWTIVATMELLFTGVNVTHVIIAAMGWVAILVKIKQDMKPGG